MRKKLAAVLREEVLPRFAREGSDASDPRSMQAQTAAAAKLGVSQSTISRLVNEERGGSVKLVRAVAKLLNKDPATFLISNDDTATRELGPPLRESHGYDAALQEARKRIEDEGRAVSAEALHAAGDTRMLPQLPRVPAALLVTLAVEFQREIDLRKAKPKGRKK